MGHVLGHQHTFLSQHGHQKPMLTCRGEHPLIVPNELNVVCSVVHLAYLDAL